MLTKYALKVTMLYIRINKEVHTMNSKKIENLLQQELIEAVGYLRLSRDDGEDESTSITNQRAIIEDWAKYLFNELTLLCNFTCSPSIVSNMTPSSLASFIIVSPLLNLFAYL